VRFDSNGRYLVICMNRSHALNDHMFGFVNVVGEGDDDDKYARRKKKAAGLNEPGRLCIVRGRRGTYDAAAPTQRESFPHDPQVDDEPPRTRVTARRHSGLQPLRA
jgi:hypothetical protein